MKRLRVLLIFLVTIGSFANSKHHTQVSTDIGIFYSSLTRHGEWIESNWGDAWRPLHVVHGWRPYMHGRWAWTDYGWYWVSYEPFGWATFHYGRWQYDEYYGWIWIPDDVWGPAWVEWRYDDDYVGWAPLPPVASFSINIGITFSRHWVAPVHYWNFISCRQFTSKHIFDYIQPIDRVRRIYGNTREGSSIRHEQDRVMNRGIDVKYIERRANTKINRLDIIQRDRNQGERIVQDGKIERIEAYRPKFNEQSRQDRSQTSDIQRRDQKRNLDQIQERSDNRISRLREDAEKQQKSVRETVPTERKIETKSPQRYSDRESQQRRVEGREMNQQRIENNEKERPRVERSQPQVRERPQPQVRERQQPQVRERQQPSERSKETRRETERKRKP